MTSVSTTLQSAIGPFWPGFDGIKHLIIFGDSYSAIGYNPRIPHPAEDIPLGVKFPGNTYTEACQSANGEWEGTPNWVGHLVVSRRDKGHRLLVYDYAVGGHTVLGVRSQVEQWFLPEVGQRPEWAPWVDADSLFATWVGINDCAYTGDHDKSMDILFNAQEELYIAGARNFMFIDVPPIHRSPAIGKSRANDFNTISKYTRWNTSLRSRAGQFHKAHPETSVLLFSSWQTFDNVLNDPEMYGFQMEDRKKRCGAIWVDHLHPTSAMQNVVARDVEEFLSGFPASEAPSTGIKSSTGPEGSHYVHTGGAGEDEAGVKGDMIDSI